MSDNPGLADTVSNAALKDLVDTCLRLGELSPSALSDIGVSLQTLENPQLRCPEAVLIDVWQWLDRHSKRPALGLEIGSVINPAAKGLLASWVSQANNLGEALTIFRDNIALMSPSESWTFAKEGDNCVLEFQLAVEKGYPNMAIERSLAALVTWGRALCGVSLDIEKAEFAFTLPADTELYEAIFGDNLHFGAAHNRLILRKPLLNLPVLSGNEFLKAMMAQAARQALVKQPSCSERVLAEIANAYEVESALTIDAISNALSLSRQTLYRKLKQEGCEFKSLLEQFKKEQALLLLQSDRLNITSAALSLGYKDSSSFTKAFKRWYGLTPKQYLFAGDL